MKHLRLLKLLVASLTLLTIFGIIHAQNTPIPMDKRFKIGKLPNGMTYYICKNAKPEKRVELRLAVNAGAVQEDDNQLGMAHLVEHMCFNGTAHFPKNDLIHYLQSVGVGFGDGINGYTSFDETVYMLTVPSDSVNVLNNGILVMEDWANAVSFDTAEISKERGVVIEEWRLRLGAYQRMQNKYIPILLKGSKYANRLPIGTKESILQTSPENIIRYYKEWYRPELMAFIVVGDINPDSIEKKIINDFSKIKSPATVRPKETYKIEDNIEPLVCVVSDKENTGTRITLAFKTAKAPSATLNDYKQGIIYSMFCGILNQRLNELTKKSEPPFLGAGAYYGNLWVRTREAFQVSINVKEDGTEKGLKAVLTEIERVKRYGYTQPELDRLKKIYLKNSESQYNERDKQESGNIVWSCVSSFLENESVPDVEFRYEFLKKNIETIQLSDINKLAGEWITDKNEVAIVMGIEKEGVTLPTEQELKTTLAWAKKIDIEPYKENLIATNLMTKKPKAGVIVSEKQITTTGITELILSNGLKVAFKPTDFKNDEIQMFAYSEGGTSLFGTEYKLSGQFASSIVSEGGIDKFSKIDLNKMLAGKNASAGPFISDIKSGFSGQSSVSDFETMLQLVYLYFTSPRRDEETYKSLVNRISASYKNALSSPNSYFFNQVQLRTYNNNPDAPGVFPSEKDWQQLSLEKAMEVYKRSFSNASNFTFMFVGSFKPETMKPLLETYLGSLPSTGKTETFVDKGLRPITGPVSEIINKGTDPKTMVYLTINDTTKWSVENSHSLWSIKNIMDRIYTDKLREEMSGVYGFSIRADVERFPYENYNFTMTIPCSPDNADKLVNAVISEIERIKTKGFTKEEIEKEKESQRRERESDLKLNGGWMFIIDRAYSIDKNFERAEKPYKLIELVTVENLNEIAKKYLDTSKMVRFTLYPENFKKDSALK
jgi:zinc protease